MLSQDTKEEVFKVLLRCRYAFILDIKEKDCAEGFNMKPFELITDEEIIEEYRKAYNINPKNDELYDRMIAEMEAHKMLTPTVSNNL